MNLIKAFNSKRIFRRKPLIKGSYLHGSELKVDSDGFLRDQNGHLVHINERIINGDYEFIQKNHLEKLIKWIYFVLKQLINNIKKENKNEST